MDDKKPILFSTASYGYLKESMMKSNRFLDGQIARGQSKDGPVLEDKPFPDGERYHRILTEVADYPVVLLGGTIDDRETMELLDLGQAMVEKGALSLSMIVPYFGYSTMERQVNPGEVVKAKNRARMLSAIPTASFGNRIYLLDLHSEGIPHYFENSLVAVHVYARDIVIDAIVDIVRAWQKSEMVVSAVADGSDRIKTSSSRAASGEVLDWLDDAHFTLASTDAGRAKWVESLAQDMADRGIPVHPAFIIKRRVSGSETSISDISADVEGKFVVIYDDMIRTGGSAIKAAQAYTRQGAKGIALICTHGVLPGNALQGLRDSGCFFKIIVTDSHPRAVQLEDDFLKVISVGDLLVESILHRH